MPTYSATINETTRSTAAAFVLGTAAADASDRILYDQARQHRV